ncbi:MULTISPECIES: protein kinase [unclassified Crossiella]|uniref:protein kinase domain-containing protein n=1 Tax=unclassified Crossiella TaxID=2620835 RepID=UPI001FFEFCA5|nr:MULTISPECIES: protein kinase [unclassified Crossiella]MCK2243808.1 protein kinase [Crossiella sp. S99.2]MCK2257667.1 protein kinase [Crossiella sp. S99.1]
MKRGESLNGYRLTTKPTNADAGKCLWAFAEKDGAEYFVKEFLDPKRPRTEFMGSPAARTALLRQCTDFEERHWAVMNRLNGNDLGAGNLVLAVDFFSADGRYYKVTRRLRTVDPGPVHLLGAARKRVLLGTLAESLGLLHRLNIVHGDLTPRNVLVHRPVGSRLHTAKLIDFDDAYCSGTPPAAEMIGGDPVYGAPEWLRYLHHDPATGAGALTTAVDVFAFALVIHHQLTGALPAVSGHDSVAEAVNDSVRPRLDPRITPALATMLHAMLDPDPAARPSIVDISPVLLEHGNLELTGAYRVGRLRVNLGGPVARRAHSGR